MTKKKKRRGSGTEAIVSMSAMIDVVFLLLIFFIVTFVPPRVESHMAINAPGPSGTPPRPDQFRLEAEVHPDGIRYNSRTITLDQLEDKLLKAVTNQADIPFFITVNPAAQEGQVVAVLDICGKIDLQNISLLTLKSRNVW